AEFDLAETPLEEAIGAEANVLVIMDDSGSMDWTLSTPDRDGCMVLSSAGLVSGSAEPRTQRFCYWLPLRTNIYSASSRPSVPSEEALAADPDMAGNEYGVWRARSSHFNTIYYDPEIRYTPWKGLSPLDNTEFGDVDPTDAPMDPTQSGNRIDLTVPVSYNAYGVPAITGPDAEPDCRRIYRSFGGYYLYCTAPDGKTMNVTDYYIPRYYTTTATGMPEWDDPHTLVEIRDPAATYPGGPERDDCAADDGDPLTCTYEQELQNFANWFTYYRSREYVAKGSLGLVVADSNNLRVGFAVINDANDRQPIRSMNSSFRTGAKNTVLDEIYAYNSNGGTPLRRALDRAGRHYDCRANDIFGSTSNTAPGDAACPILPVPEGQCQPNFTLLFTDGFWNGGNPITDVDNADGDDDTAFDGGIFADDNYRTLADIAMYWYERDLWADSVLDDFVPTTARDRDVAPASAFSDPEKEIMHQHMKTYTVSFGQSGNIDPLDPTQFPDDLSAIDPSFLPFSWGDPFSDNAAKIDDMFHAALNGRGEYLSASNPVLLTEAFARAFEDFETGSTSVSAVAFNSTSLQAGTLLYRGFFDMKNNSGELIAVELLPTGELADDIEWSAAEQLDAKVDPDFGGTSHLARNVVTFDPLSRGGIPFRFDALNDFQKALIDDDGTLDDDEGIVPYLRGDRSRERPVGGLRERLKPAGLLGDIVHSNVTFVG
ncbi:MAG TPA: hypothetical protein RMF84_12740, partial [Polyangiaceae bacterium LLY-WYZ-14_1]|nr:hypothetical protein [Polyangiaceae bacterium LLY-WYZ-14_1]